MRRFFLSHLQAHLPLRSVFFLSFCLAFTLLGVFALLSPHPLKAQGSPTLSVPDATINVMNSSTFTIPVNFTSNTTNIASVTFSLDIDETCLTFDGITDGDLNGIPDAVTGLPSGYSPSISYDDSDTDGEIDVILSDQSNPLDALSDGALATFAFGVQSGCRTTDGTLTNVDFLFSTDPAASFGDTSGGAVAGAVVTATVPLRFNANPTDISLSTTSVDENQVGGTVVATLSSTDADADLSDTHTYSLVSGTGDTDNDAFTLVSGSLKAAAVFDFETQESYEIRVQSTDRYGGTYTEAFTISVNDLNEAPTQLSINTNSVDENQSSGTTVGTLNAVDVDAGDTVSYSLVSGVGDTGNSSFSIVGTELQLSESFNYEEQQTYNVRVRASDTLGPLTLDRVFTINVNDVNDTPVAVDDIYEPADQVVSSPIALTVLTNDTDEDNDNLSFTAVGTPSSGSVVTDSTTITYTPAVDYNGVVSFTYTAVDDNAGGVLTDTATVSLTVVAADARGDCNADGIVDAGDYTAIMLEQFDTDSSSNWYEIYQSGFIGSPLGCDANANQNYSIADLTCAVLVTFGDSTCTTATVAAAAASQSAALTIDADLHGVGGRTVDVPVRLRTNGHSIAAASFAIDFDDDQLSWDDTDADGKGIPDAVRFTTPPGFVTTAHYNAAASRLEVAVYAVMVPMPTLDGGVLATFTFGVHDSGTSATPIALVQSSLGNDRGQAVPVEIQDGAVQILHAQQSLFLPLLQQQ